MTHLNQNYSGINFTAFDFSF